MEEKTNMKKRIIAIVLAVVVVALASTVTVLVVTNRQTTTTTTTTTTTKPGDSTTTEPNGGVVVPSADSYTYNTYLSVFPTTWNSHVYKTSTDSEILGYTENGFYTFDYNEDRTGFIVVPDMAVGDPKDVTSDYVGEKWGIEDGESARAWKITIRSDIKWEDGTLITANDFVESAKRLLNPAALNYRADSLYSGDMVISGAKDYFYGGRFIKNSTSMIDVGYVSIEDLVVNGDGYLENPDGEGVVYFNLDDGNEWSSNSLYTYATYGYLSDSEAATAAWERLSAAADEEKYVAMTPALAQDLQICIACLKGFETVEDYAAALEEANGEGEGIYAYQEWNEFCYYGKTWETVSADSIGIIALSDTEIVIILEKELEGFYLLYNLTGNLGLINVELYDKCITIDENGLYTSTYGTNAETYMSYGPYKLTSFQTDKQFVLERNDQWYGYNDHEAGEGWYQTSRIVYDWINDPNTAFQAFLRGEITSKGLDADTIKEYSGSDRLYYTDGASTFFVAMNPDLNTYKTWESTNPGYNKSILTVKEFRMALSFSLDRKAFCLACDPTSSAAFAVFNSMNCSDPDNGTMYRETEQAKDVLLEFWGISQEDVEKLYGGDKDEAIDSITGYNLAQAKEYFQKAYDYAVENGIYTKGQKIKIVVGIPSQHSFYSNGYDYLEKCWSEALEGTPFEGMLEFAKDDTVGNGFGDALRDNKIDLLFGVGWTGSSLNPYGLISAYVWPSYQYDSTAWNTKSEMLQITLGGKTYEASVYEWSYILSGSKVEVSVVGTEDTEVISYGTSANMDDRLEILAALEGSVLRQYNLLPLTNESSASLLSYKVNYGNEEYVYGVGRGGIQYMTYNYTDTEWEAFVASQGGTLNYK